MDATATIDRLARMFGTGLGPRDTRPGRRRGSTGQGGGRRRGGTGPRRGSTAAGVILGLAGMAALAACGSGTPKAASDSGQASGSPKGIVAQTLTIQFTAPLSLNPALEYYNEDAIPFARLAYEPLLYQLPDGSFAPDLATSWGYVAGTSNTEFDITLRPGVTFTDGTPLTPQSVINSMEYFKKANGPVGFELAGLKSGTVLSAHSLRLTFSAPQPELPYLLTQDQLAGQIIGPKGLANPSSLATSTDGAGPYILNSAQTVANSSYTFTANPKYWDPKAVHYKSVVVKVIADPQTALSALESDQADAVLGISSSFLSSATSAGKILAAPGTISNLFLMDRDAPSSPISKLAVRQAMNDAMDRPALATSIGGYGASATDQTAVPGAAGYVASLNSAYPYSLSKAKSLLRQAGYPNGFTLTVLDNGVLDPNGDLGSAIKSELSKIGVNVQLTDQNNPAEFFPDALSKKYEATIFPISNNGVGYYYAAESALSPTNNVFGSTTPQLQSLLTKLASAPTTSAEPLEEQLNTYFTQNAWFLPLFVSDTTYLSSTSLANVTLPTALCPVVDPVGPTATSSWYPSK
jgi:peptide/nickel transport system substrate-binding protein